MQKYIDDNTKVPISRIFLFREPTSRTANHKPFRLAVFVAEGERVLFLYNKKSYPTNWVYQVMPEKDRFVCEYYATEEKYTVVVSQKLSNFLDCDEVESKEIYENCAYLPELMTRLKTFQKMKEGLFALKNRDAVSVQELTGYDRQLVCIQKHGKIAERKNHNYYFSNTKKLQDKENYR